jgi:uncharacterized metal-binding protein
MAYFDDSADTLIFTCPGCGQVHHIPLPVRVSLPTGLSDMAYRILTAQSDAANQWRRGKAVSLRQWGIIIYADPRTVQRAMRELVRAGYAVTVPYGTHGRVQYAGIPTRAIPVAQAAA